MRDRELKILAAGLIAGIALSSLVSFALGSSATGGKEGGKETGTEAVPPEVVGKNTRSFVNERFLEPQGLEGKLGSAEEYGELLYRVNIEILRGNESLGSQPVWVTRDGEFLIAGDVINMSEEGTGEAQGRVEVSADDDPYLGREDAEVVIVEFSDYQCPYCKRFRDQTLPKIMNNYGDSVKLVYRDFPLQRVHPMAFNASVAANCAGEQGMYFEFHDLLFENTERWSSSRDFSPYAQELGLDMEKFSSCLSSERAREEVRDDIQDARRVGVSSTPTFFVNGVLIEGARPYSSFKQVIDSELER